MNITNKIFRNKCPYKNGYQTDAIRLLFVCSVGMLRSPTAQIVATMRGHNARACGSDLELALIPMSVNLINWSDYIIFMNKENYIESCKEFNIVGYKEEIIKKSTIWDIPDSYEWNNSYVKELIEINLIKLGL